MSVSHSWSGTAAVKSRWTWSSCTGGPALRVKPRFLATMDRMRWQGCFGDPKVFGDLRDRGFVLARHEVPSRPLVSTRPGGSLGLDTFAGPLYGGRSQVFVAPRPLATSYAREAGPPIDRLQPASLRDQKVTVGAAMRGTVGDHPIDAALSPT